MWEFLYRIRINHENGKFANIDSLWQTSKSLKNTNFGSCIFVFLLSPLGDFTIRNFIFIFAFLTCTNKLKIIQKHFMLNICLLIIYRVADFSNSIKVTRYKAYTVVSFQAKFFKFIFNQLANGKSVVQLHILIFNSLFVSFWLHYKRYVALAPLSI